MLGLTMSAKLLRRPGLGKTLVSLHEHLALVGLGAIAVHGLALLGDPWLHPGLGGLTVPFTLAYQPLATGLGVIAGYLAALLGLSFYARRRIGVRLWRRLHRATILVWVLGAVHTLGAGSDAGTPWAARARAAPAVPDRLPVRAARCSGARRAGPAGARPRRRRRGAESRHSRPTRAVAARGVAEERAEPRRTRMLVIAVGGLAAQRCCERLRRMASTGA